MKALPQFEFVPAVRESTPMSPWRRSATCSERPASVPVVSSLRTYHQPAITNDAAAIRSAFRRILASTTGTAAKKYALVRRPRPNVA